MMKIKKYKRSLIIFLIAEHCGEDFSNWFVQFLVNCYDEDKKVQMIIDNIPKLKEYVNEYLTAQQIDYTKFVDIIFLNLRDM